MSLRLFDADSPAFARFLEAMTVRRGESGGAVDQAVAKIIAAVRNGGDRALITFVRRFDGVRLEAGRLRVSAAELAAARAALPAAERRALELAARRIADFHRHTVEKSFNYTDALGMRLGQTVRPLRRVGIYVPGGVGAYPSSVLMNAIPARVAGVREIVMVSPPTREGDRPGVLAAAAIAGVSEVYRAGGAHAIAALAYGTQTIRPVDKIVGPGNSYVQAAKRMVYGVIDIDKMAGPSELLVIADGRAHPDWIAADLIAQAEHGSGDESGVLLTTSRRLAQEVVAAIDVALTDLPRALDVRRSLTRRGAAGGGAHSARGLQAGQSDRAGASGARPRSTASVGSGRCKRRGRFFGRGSPAALGDYLAGPNHVLPTGGTARFASPLGAYDFVKRTSIIGSAALALKRLGPEVARLARMEGFEGHARSIELRTAGPSVAGAKSEHRQKWKMTINHARFASRAKRRGRTA